MGAYFRFFEHGIEKKLKQNASRGVQPRPVSGLGITRGLEGEITDRRQLIPPLGLREYWYPAMAARRVPKKRPLFWTMLGDEIAFFQGKDGEISAVSDVCPHRGASMSDGFCFFKGTITCPYHGATFDESGQCKAFLPEGPDSKMVDNLPIKVYPTRVLGGYVFIWMGESEPAPIEDDVPPEFFGDKAKDIHMFDTYTYWHCSWLVAIENQNDSHNGFFAHRNSLMQLVARRGRSRTPLGPRSRLYQDRALIPMMKNQNYYVDPETGKEPYQLYYPGVDGHFPVGKWRKWLWTLCKPFTAMTNNRFRKPYRSGAEEWADVSGSLWHLPCMVRVNFGYFAFTRSAVPVSENMCRVIYFHHRPKMSFALGRLWQKIWFYGYFNYWLHYNFSGQDGTVAAPCRYWTPENLSSTDSHLVMLRKLVTERSRDAKLLMAKNAALVQKNAMVGESEVRFFKHQAAHNVTTEMTLEDSEKITEGVTERRLLGG